MFSSSHQVMLKPFIIVILLSLSYSGFGQISDTICIENVNVIPLTEEVVHYNQRVIIANGIIIKIEPAVLPRSLPSSQVIDGSNKYLIPGLSEMHYHFRSNDIESDFKLLIANGITTVRNMAEFSGQDHVGIRQRLFSGE